MSAAHTPGPWIYAAGQVWRGSDIEFRDGKWSETVPVPRIVHFIMPTSNGEADALLIAAAPDLLEALKSVVYAFGMNNAEPQEMARAIGAQMEKASAAIKKAEGAA